MKVEGLLLWVGVCLLVNTFTLSWGLDREEYTEEDASTYEEEYENDPRPNKFIHYEQQHVLDGYGKLWHRIKFKEFIQISASGTVIIGLTYRGEIFIRTGVDEYHKTGTGWQKIDGILKEITAANGKMLGLTPKNEVLYRTGVNASNPSGTGWKTIDGQLKYVATGDGKIMGIKSNDRIVYRTGVDSTHPEGTGWKEMDGKLDFVKIGDGKIVGVGPGERAYYRTGIDAGHPFGKGWEQYKGNFTEIAVGDNIMMGLNHWGLLKVRTGMSEKHPDGTGWVTIPSGFKDLDIGKGFIIGLNGANWIWYKQKEKKCKPPCVHGKITKYCTCKCDKGWIGKACDIKECKDNVPLAMCKPRKVYCNTTTIKGKWMSEHCCDYCLHAKCENSGKVTEKKCLMQAELCENMDAWTDTNCCRSCNKAVGCIDTGRWDCRKYRRNLRKIKYGKYKDKKMSKLLSLHCCKTMKSLKPPQCVDNPHFKKCKWKKFMHKQCPRNSFIRLKCCATCKKILAGK